MTNPTEFPTNLHDSSLLGIKFSLDESRVVRAIDISFIDESDAYIDISFSNVVAYDFSNFLHQNIVLDAEVFSGINEISQFFREEGKTVNLENLGNGKFEMTVFSPSVGMSGFAIYTSKNIKGPYRK